MELNAATTEIYGTTSEIRAKIESVEESKWTFLSGSSTFLLLHTIGCFWRRRWESKKLHAVGRELISLSIAEAPREVDFQHFRKMLAECGLSTGLPKQVDFPQQRRGIGSRTFPVRRFLLIERTKSCR